VSGNSFGEVFRVLTFGESHGPAVGCVVEGCPAGLAVDVEDIRRDLRRRRPGGGGASSARREADEPEILSGVFEGKTLGTPIAIVIRNTDQRSADYDNLRDLYRPGHGDWTWEAKYGFRDHRGGGRSSAREMAGRVAAGAIARLFLEGYGVSIRAWVSGIGGLSFPGPGEEGFDWEEIEKNPLRIPHRAGAEEAAQKLEALRLEGDSAGGTLSCRVRGLPPGLGEPVFGKLPARIAGALLSVGACRGVEFGAGFGAALLRGSENNDEPLPAARPAEGRGAERALPAGVPLLDFKTNRAGGALGGISTGEDLDFRAVFKPPASIAKKQETVNRKGERAELLIRGRHDVSVLPRAVPVAEAMTALVLADLILLQRCAR
jgi:chorismate synthase